MPPPGKFSAGASDHYCHEDQCIAFSQWRTWFNCRPGRLVKLLPILADDISKLHTAGGGRGRDFICTPLIGTEPRITTNFYIKSNFKTLVVSQLRIYQLWDDVRFSIDMYSWSSHFDGEINRHRPPNGLGDTDTKEVVVQ